jgi:hypothetical protein
MPQDAPQNKAKILLKTEHPNHSVRVPVSQPKTPGKIQRWAISARVATVTVGA